MVVLITPSLSRWASEFMTLQDLIPILIINRVLNDKLS